MSGDGGVRIEIVEGQASETDSLRREMGVLRDRAQGGFQNPIAVRQGTREPDNGIGDSSDFYLEEVVKGSFLQGKKYKDLIAISPGLTRGDTVVCWVFDERLQGIVEAELPGYAKSIGGDTVRIIKEYERK